MEKNGMCKPDYAYNFQKNHSSKEKLILALEQFLKECQVESETTFLTHRLGILKELRHRIGKLDRNSVFNEKAIRLMTNGNRYNDSNVDDNFQESANFVSKEVYNNILRRKSEISFEPKKEYDYRETNKARQSNKKIKKYEN